MSREFIFYFVGITSQIFIIGIGLWLLKSLLNKKNNPGNSFELKLNMLKEYFETKFNFVFKEIQDIKEDLKDIKSRLR